METATSQTSVLYRSPTIRSWREEGHFIIPGVAYRGETGTYRLFETMTPAMTQDKLSELYETEKSKGNPHPTDAPLIWAISTRGYELRDKALESFQIH